MILTVCMFIIGFTISYLIQKRKWKREAEEYLKEHMVD